MKYILIIALFLFVGFSVDKKIKVEMTVPEWNLIYECLDNSTSSHAKVKQAFDLLNKQIVPQIDTTKK